MLAMGRGAAKFTRGNCIFYPPVLPGQEWIGIIVVLIGMLANLQCSAWTKKLIVRLISRLPWLPQSVWNRRAAAVDRRRSDSAGTATELN